MSNLKQYQIVGLDIETYRIVKARVSVFSRKDALNVAYDHFHLIFPYVRVV